ncbi:MAG: hypothetical protein AAF378_14615 [Cyanobacteria bacterium P01_A01_bin.84]
MRRRRFGELAIASIAVTTFSSFGKKVLGQKTLPSSSAVIYGVSLPSTANQKPQEKLQNQIKLQPEVARDIENTTPAVNITANQLESGEEAEKIELSIQKVDNRQTRTETKSKAVFSEPKERITGFTFLPDGTIVVSTVASSKRGDFSRLLFTSGTSKERSAKSKKVSGFTKRNSTVESLLGTKDNQLLAVISLNGGIPPFELGFIDPKSGKIRGIGADLALPVFSPVQRYSNITQAQDGTIYGTTLGSEGTLLLTTINLEKKSPLTGRSIINEGRILRFQNKTLGNDLLSLAVSPDGELYALGNPEGEKINSLFIIDPKSGVMKKVRNFSVDKIAFAPKNLAKEKVSWVPKNTKINTSFQTLQNLN